LPTFYDLFTGAWVGEEQGHGPIIFGLALWLIYRKWPEMLEGDHAAAQQLGRLAHPGHRPAGCTCWGARRRS
jgi:hypothetical protein